MALHLALVLLALVPETEAQKQVREFEERLRQFPPAEVVAYNLGLSCKHACWLEKSGAAIPSHRREAYAAHLADANRLHDTWFYLDQAKCRLRETRSLADGGRMEPKYLPTMERLLARTACLISALEKQLGEEDFRAGRMPPPVPVWRFQRID